MSEHTSSANGSNRCTAGIDPKCSAGMARLRVVHSYLRMVYIFVFACQCLCFPHFIVAQIGHMLEAVLLVCQTLQVVNLKSTAQAQNRDWRTQMVCSYLISTKISLAGGCKIFFIFSFFPRFNGGAFSWLENRSPQGRSRIFVVFVHPFLASIALNVHSERV